MGLLRPEKSPETVIFAPISGRESAKKPRKSNVAKMQRYRQQLWLSGRLTTISGQKTNR